MTDKLEVIEALSGMPENVSRDEIIEEMQIIAAVRKGRADVAASRSKTQEEVEQMVVSWIPDTPSQS